MYASFLGFSVWCRQFQGVGFKDLGFRVSVTVCRVQGFGVLCWRLRVQGLGFGVWSKVFGVHFRRFRVQGIGVVKF